MYIPSITEVYPANAKHYPAVRSLNIAQTWSAFVLSLPLFFLIDKRFSDENIWMLFECNDYSIFYKTNEKENRVRFCIQNDGRGYEI
jgi:hypothetical protein